MEIKAKFEPLSPEHSTIVAVVGGIFRGKKNVGEVGKPTEVTLTLQPSVPLPKDTIITIDFPKANPEAPVSEQRSYFGDSTDPSRPDCSPGIGAAAGFTAQVKQLKCIVELDSADFDGNPIDRLTITGSLPNGLDRGEMI